MLAALHAKFRADLDAAPLEDLKEAARIACAPAIHSFIGLTIVLPSQVSSKRESGLQSRPLPCLMLTAGHTGGRRRLADYGTCPTRPVLSLCTPSAQAALAMMRNDESTHKSSDSWLCVDQSRHSGTARQVRANPSDDASSSHCAPSEPTSWKSYGGVDEAIEVAVLGAPPLKLSGEIETPSSQTRVEVARWGETRTFDDGVPVPRRWGVSSSVETYDQNHSGTLDEVQAEPSVSTRVNFMDGTWIQVKTQISAVAFDLLRATAARMCIDTREASAFGLFERVPASEPTGRLSRRVAHSEKVSELGETTIVLAVRLFSAPLHAAAIRGARSPDATASERAVARIMYAQAVAAAMTGAYAVLPRLDDEADRDLVSSKIRSEQSDTVPERWRDACPSTDARSFATRLRLGALRLWSRAIDVVDSAEAPSLQAAAEHLITTYGTASFCPPPACAEGDLLREFGVVVGDDDDLEIETTEGAGQGSTTTMIVSPEAKYIELCARSPAYDSTLFACITATRFDEALMTEPAGVRPTSSRNGRPARWLAISRRGVSILSADASARLHDVPLDCARRWRTKRSDILCLEYERPPNRWPASASRRASSLNMAPSHVKHETDAAWEYFASYFRSEQLHVRSEDQPEARLERDANGRVDTVDREQAPVMRVQFELEIDPSIAAVGGADEAVSLLDDYCLCDLAETPPAYGWQETGGGEASETDESTKQHAMTAGFYDALVAAVVRPPRFHYDSRLLGPSSFHFAGKRYHRHDLVLASRANHRLHVSHWRLIEESDASPEDRSAPCIVFVHANSASRAQCCNYISFVLSLGCSLVAFDCAGSGLSDGSLVTLGWREAQDLRVVLEWLATRQDVSAVAVWGQSMGAAAIIYYQGLAAKELSHQGVDLKTETSPRLSTWPTLDAVVLDSPYADFRQLATHIANERRGVLGGFSIPTVLLDLFLSTLDASVKQRAGFSPLAKLSPIRHAPYCGVPALFIRARDDSLIAQQHVEALAMRYVGPRTLAIVEGTHSSPRDVDARKFIGRFLERRLPLPPEHRRPSRRHAERHLACAPWTRPKMCQPNTADI